LVSFLLSKGGRSARSRTMRGCLRIDVLQRDRPAPIADSPSRTRKSTCAFAYQMSEIRVRMREIRSRIKRVRAPIR
jgi:hypothetical protein